ncbi:hypothetical protein HYH03_009420 [Edaphochlamys debaryana]|uniref:Uncharacterized protein n=1 Tax=Edaphochlamys debaryana TaxID=47281 RepID=A0A835Y441_9CHLO|nr:hypothetical protein HYH03_009420 [Edaphochlamys debaryana]|eukprot:KAG2492170.1 hypothetical protein HYH03_009420 [Edaphochlamys debaryana]
MMVVNDRGDVTGWMEAALSNDNIDQARSYNENLHKYILDPLVGAAVKGCWSKLSSHVIARVAGGGVQV